jgi:hypothetical protein
MDELAEISAGEKRSPGNEGRVRHRSEAAKALLLRPRLPIAGKLWLQRLM